MQTIELGTTGEQLKEVELLCDAQREVENRMPYVIPDSLSREKVNSMIDQRVVVESVVRSIRRQGS